MSGAVQKLLFEALSQLPSHAINEIAVDSYVQLREEIGETE